MMANPCPTCISLADCDTCLERLRYEGATPDPEPDDCLLCVDIVHLTQAGEIWERVAGRLHLKTVSLTKHCTRHGLAHLIPPGGWQ